MRLFHFNMVKLPSFYPVFSFGMPETFYWLSLWNFKKETSTISCGTAGFFHSIHFYLLSYLVGGCFLPKRTPFAQPPHQTKALGGERNPFWRKIFPFLPQPPPPLFQRLSRLSNPCTTVLRDVAKCPLYRPSEKTRLKFLTLS